MMNTVLSMTGQPVLAAYVACHTDFCDTVMGWIVATLVVTLAPALAALLGRAAAGDAAARGAGAGLPVKRYAMVAGVAGFLAALAVSDALQSRGEPWWFVFATPIALAPVAWVVGRLRLLG
jgi:hypothetical protein